MPWQESPTMEEGLRFAARPLEIVLIQIVRATGLEPACFAFKVRDPRPLDHAR